VTLIDNRELNVLECVAHRILVLADLTPYLKHHLDCAYPDTTVRSAGCNRLKKRLGRWDHPNLAERSRAGCGERLPNARLQVFSELPRKADAGRHYEDISIDWLAGDQRGNDGRLASAGWHRDEGGSVGCCRSQVASEDTDRLSEDTDRLDLILPK